MAKNRYINTRFWDDQYITTLDPIEKLLFLYFLTNPLTDVSGVYEITIKRVAFDTGLDIEVVNSVLKRFEVAKKIFYISGWLYIKNFAKHQAVNDNMQKGINRSMSELPEEIKSKITLIDEDNETLPNPSEPFELLKPEPILKLKPEPIGGVKSPTPAEEARNFFENSGFQLEVFNSICELGNPYREQVGKEIVKFVDYWTELNKSGTKQRWEQESTFEVRRRLKKWLSNFKQFDKSKTRKIWTPTTSQSLSSPQEQITE